MPKNTPARKAAGWTDRLHVFARGCGPGIVSAASDNDPTTVASLAVIGATTGYGLTWLIVLIVPMLVVVQTVSASVGTVAKAGLETIVRRRYGSGWAIVMLIAVMAVNVITLAADIEGGSAALQLLFGPDYRWFIVPFAAGTAALLVFGNYDSLERVLRYFVLVFLAYVVTAFFAKPDWGAVIHSTLVPHWESSAAYATGAVALLGTTLTSYAYVWQTIEMAQERPPLRRLGLVKGDAALGMILAGAIFWFIVVTTGATLGVHHKHVDTAADAANALVPLAGHYAGLVFGVGLLASAALAVPVLAGTSAYVFAQAFGLGGNLNQSLRRAPRFYAMLLLSLALALLLAFAGISPIRLLVYSSIAGAFGTPITLALLMLAARDRKVMGPHAISGRLFAAGWFVTAVVIAACGVYLYQTLTGGA